MLLTVRGRNKAHGDDMTKSGFDSPWGILFIFIPGFFVFATILVISFLLTLRMKLRQADQLQKKDSRLQKIIESIINLKIIKLQVG